MLAKADVRKPAVCKARARESIEGKANSTWQVIADICRHEIRSAWRADMINFLILAVSGDDRKHRWLAARQQVESSAAIRQSREAWEPRVLAPSRRRFGPSRKTGRLIPRASRRVTALSHTARGQQSGKRHHARTEASPQCLGDGRRGPCLSVIRRIPSSHRVNQRLSLRSIRSRDGVATARSVQANRMSTKTIPKRQPARLACLLATSCSALSSARFVALCKGSSRLGLGVVLGGLVVWLEFFPSELQCFWRVRVQKHFSIPTFLTKRAKHMT